MSTEELMQPRYKVISSYPNTRLEVGQILNIEGSDSDKDGFALYPNIFQRLEWWEERRTEDLPKYLKYDIINVGKIVVAKIDSYDFNNWKEFFATTDATVTGRLFIKNASAFPATEEEYNAYLKTQIK